VPGTYKYEITFRSGHDLINGMATYALLDNLIRHAACTFECKDGDIDVQFGDGYKNLSPPFRVALGLLPATLDSPTRARIDAIRDQRNKDRAGALSFPCKRGVSVPGKTHRAAVAFTAEESKAVLAAKAPQNYRHTSIPLSNCTCCSRSAGKRGFCAPREVRQLCDFEPEKVLQATV
jgi:hypothetical protein